MPKDRVLAKSEQVKKRWTNQPFDDLTNNQFNAERSNFDFNFFICLSFCKMHENISWTKIENFSPQLFSTLEKLYFRKDIV